MGELNKETKQLLEAGHAAGPEVGRSAKTDSPLHTMADPAVQQRLMAASPTEVTPAPSWRRATDPATFKKMLEAGHAAGPEVGRDVKNVVPLHTMTDPEVQRQLLAASEVDQPKRKGPSFGL